MQQAVTTIVVGLCLVWAQPVVGGTALVTGAGPIERARRLIEAGDHAAALTVLEDALLDSPVRDRPTILRLLRQSYEVLARKAEAAGQARVAAHYRDNLAILDRSRGTNRSDSPAAELQRHPHGTPPLRPEPGPAEKPASDGPRNARPPTLVVADRDQGSVTGARPLPPLVGEPVPLPEPERLPPPVAPGPMAARTVPHPFLEPDSSPHSTPPSPISRSGTTPLAPGKSLARIPDSGPAPEANPRRGPDRVNAPGTRFPHSLEPDDPDAPTAAINPGAAMAGTVSEPTQPRDPGPAAGAGGAAMPAATHGRQAKGSDLHRPIGCSSRGDTTMPAASTRPWPTRAGSPRIDGRTGPIAGRWTSSARSTLIHGRCPSGTRSRRRSRTSGG